MKQKASPQELLSKYVVRGKIRLKGICEGLSPKQRKILVYGISTIYLLCSLFMIAQFFVTPKSSDLPIPKNEHLDSPINKSHSIDYHQLNTIPQLWTRNNKTN